jgi:hypothetical protein
MPPVLARGKAADKRLWHRLSLNHDITIQNEMICANCGKVVDCTFAELLDHRRQCNAVKTRPDAKYHFSKGCGIRRVHVDSKVLRRTQPACYQNVREPTCAFPTLRGVVQEHLACNHQPMYTAAVHCIERTIAQAKNRGRVSGRARYSQNGVSDIFWDLVNNLPCCCQER